MAAGAWFLRIAEPVEPWDPAVPLAATAAKDLLAPSWSMFSCATIAFARTILAAYYGGRSGRGPMHSVAYVRLGHELLQSLASTRLDHTPQNFVVGGAPGWPPEVAAAHYDLSDLDEPAISTMLHAVRSAADDLVRVSRIELLSEQVLLLRRHDCSERFRTHVGQRLRKLSENEPPVFEQVVATCKEAGIEPPTRDDFRK